MTYSDKYLAYLKRARNRAGYQIKHSRFPGTSNVVFRLHTEKPNVVQVGYLLRPRINYSDAEYMEYRRNKPHGHLPWAVETKYGVLHPMFELHSTGIHIFKYKSRVNYPVPEVTKQVYGTRISHDDLSSCYNSSADITLNNALAKVSRLFHKGNGIREVHGFHWSLDKGSTYFPENFTGDVFWTAATNELTGAVREPRRIVDAPVRKRMNTLLRKTYKRMRVLSRMGVNLVEQPESFNAINKVSATTLLDMMESFDARNLTETMNLAKQLSARLRQHWQTPNIEHLGPSGLLDDPRTLERVRRALSRELNLVRYE